MTEETKDVTRGGRARKGVGKPNLTEGKTKRIEPVTGSIHDSELVKITTKDSLTANDAAMKQETPLGVDKTKQVVSIFKFLTKNNIPNAFHSDDEEPNVFVAKNCKMLPLECVIRRQPYGSYIKRFPHKSSSDKFIPLKLEFFHKYAIVPPVEHCDNPHGLMPTTRMMPEERARELYMRDGEWTHTVYTDPVIEPEEDKWILYSAKDVRIKSDPIFDILPLVDDDTLTYIKEKLMIPCFELLEKAWKKFNVNLIDLKIEVGYTLQDELVIADVIDNDSWRIWPYGDPKRQLDKQSFRDGEEMSDVEKKYKIVTEYVRKFNEA
tara:strand:+ start:299 stop:1264 length:966 start_codon:yes stop_codon:yes gene_type:complete